MNFKETFYFIAKCLTISYEKRNRKEIEKQLSSEIIDWDKVVKVSTAQYVLPALYCNFFRANFLHYLPKNLVVYMQYVTDENRKRNLKFISQAKELNKLLLSNNIKPIFLKGTANLIAKIYQDIGERMVGDIDFIFSKEDYSKAINLLKDNGYCEVKKYDYYFPDEIHYPRLHKENLIAAIEIHHEILHEKKYLKEFNFELIEKDHQLIEEFRVLSYSNKINISIIANQINDNHYYYNRISLRNAYDVFLLSKKTNAQNAVNKLDKLMTPSSCFLAACYEIFNSVDSLTYNQTKETVYYLKNFRSQFNQNKKTNTIHKLIQIYLFVKNRFIIICKAMIFKKYRIWLFNRLTDPNWYKEKLVQLNLKKK